MKLTLLLALSFLDLDLFSSSSSSSFPFPPSFFPPPVPDIPASASLTGPAQNGESIPLREGEIFSEIRLAQIILRGREKKNST